MKETELLKTRLLKARTKKIAKNYVEKIGKPNCILTYEEQITIVHHIAMYNSDDYIIKEIQEKFNKTINKMNIAHYRSYSAWKPKIEEFRKEFESKIQDEELSSKRVRVRELSKMYRRLEPNDKKTKESVDVLCKIREEIEGKTSGSVSLNQYNQYNGLTDDELRKVIVENTRFLEIAEKNKTFEVTKEIINGSENNG